MAGSDGPSPAPVRTGPAGPVGTVIPGRDAPGLGRGLLRGAGPHVGVGIAANMLAWLVVLVVRSVAHGHLDLSAWDQRFEPGWLFLVQEAVVTGVLAVGGIAVVAGRGGRLPVTLVRVMRGAGARRRSRRFGVGVLVVQAVVALALVAAVLQQVHVLPG